ncbi:MAG: SRPBCC family protein [Flavobacteriales bacterium]|nr:SRPBCC family protein [Flavobacteriales bacterium]
MNLSTQVQINRPPSTVWKVITDFENCPNYIESIKRIDILEKPTDTLLGFKWKETRVMFGKEATEVMWITDYSENEFYQTRAESHGSVYISGLAVEPKDNGTLLTMSFQSQPQTFGAKLFNMLLGSMFKGSMKKAVQKDLQDIKTYCEANT